MEIRTLEGVPVAMIADTFNEAFSDYKIKFSVTEELFHKKFQAEGITPENSIGAFDGERLVGFILQGVDVINGIGYVFNAGTGVVPSHRGRKITGQMYESALNMMMEKGFTHHQLEVLHDNEKAKRVYLKMGFKDVRMVASFTGTISLEIPSSVTIRQADTIDFETLKLWRNIEPTWQNNTRCIQRAHNRHDFYIAYYNGIEAGYAAVDTLNKRVKQFAVKPSLRNNGIGSALFSHISAQYGITTFVNYDLSDTRAVALFKKIGLRQENELYEMRLTCIPISLPLS